MKKKGAGWKCPRLELKAISFCELADYAFAAAMALS